MCACHIYRADTCMTRQSAARTLQVFFFRFFFSHGKMASLSVQDVEVRAPKMICKKVITCFCRAPFIQKVSFVRCQRGVDILVLICYLPVSILAK